MDDADSLNNRGCALMAERRAAEALACFEAALAQTPDSPIFLHNCGAAMQLLGRPDDALARYGQALALRPGYIDALANYAALLSQQKRFAAAARSYTRLLALAPDTPFAPGHLLHARLMQCDWSGLAELTAAITAGVAAGKPVAGPYEHLEISSDPSALRRSAALYAAHYFPPCPGPAITRPPDPRIRLGYVSGEFRYQATSLLIAELFECHDRDRFALVGFDNGWNDGSAVRGRIDAAFEDMVDISAMGSAEAAAAVAARGIDILINLNGYFGLQRSDVFARRPAPIQVNYLGFPGTMGASYMDYIIGDSWVTPMDQEADFTENIVQLPHSYQVNDRKRIIAAATPTRAALGLPATGFVFCCFNNTFKILPDIFAIWMQLLQAIPGSVLWLLGDNPAAEANLRREASGCGVAPERLVFAPRLPLDQHLARHRQADLFLDTLPYNAHTTASDALWAGLPVLTCLGRSFAGRVAASLLHAVGLPELVADSLEDYAIRARRLAVMPEVLADLRGRLRTNRDTAPLFDTEAFTRDIEAAYTTMWTRCQGGNPPAPFVVLRQNS